MGSNWQNRKGNARPKSNFPVVTCEPKEFGFDDALDAAIELSAVALLKVAVVELTIR